MDYVLLAVVTFIDYDVKFDMSMHKVANTNLGFILVGLVYVILGMISRIQVDCD